MTTHQIDAKIEAWKATTSLPVGAARSDRRTRACEMQNGKAVKV